ncbi:hypothetical protein LZ31DRAFT_188553 [Colletotrichum somersetense]|nr:hypothetical protein LZ31DRAFT_188553 [Colletotrichum somersetense]
MTIIGSISRHCLSSWVTNAKAPGTASYFRSHLAAHLLRVTPFLHRPCPQQPVSPAAVHVVQRRCDTLWSSTGELHRFLGTREPWRWSVFWRLQTGRRGGASYATMMGMSMSIASASAWHGREPQPGNLAAATCHLPFEMPVCSAYSSGKHL